MKESNPALGCLAVWLDGDRTTGKGGTTTRENATGKAMFQMLGVFSEFERAMIRERVNAGLAREAVKIFPPHVFCANLDWYW